MSVVWDETPHLYGGLLISHGQVMQYLGFTRYPPLFDATLAAFFTVFGTSVFVGRIVTVTFALLILFVLFKLGSRAYDRKVALLSCIILASMPGFLWLSRVTLLEMALEFFFLATIYLFVEWLNTGRNTTILLSGLALGLTFLTKFQGLVVGAVILASLPFILYRNKSKAKLSKFPLFLVASCAIIVPVLFASYASGTLLQWINLLQQSDAQTILYSTRFFQPIFYLFEVTWPLANVVSPISLLVLILGLHGFGLFLWRRKPEDKLFLVWFFVVYVCFTLIATKSWRYVFPFFPVVALSAASFVSFLYTKFETAWKSQHITLDTKWMAKFLAVCLILFTSFALIYSATSAYIWISQDATTTPLVPTIHYVASGLSSNHSVMVVCPVNLIYMDMVKFYLSAYESKNNAVWQYPVLPADAYAPTFNVTELTLICQEKQTNYLLLYEYNDAHYFETNLTAPIVCNTLLQNVNFTYQTTFGTAPLRIYVFQFNATATQAQR